MTEQNDLNRIFDIIWLRLDPLVFVISITQGIKDSRST